MKTIILDFTNCKYIDEIYEIMKKEFGFPDYFGKNLDALWDCLDYYTDERTHVKILGLDTLPEKITDYINGILKIFDDLNDVMPHITFEAVSKKFSFETIRKEKILNLKEKHLSFKFCKDETDIFSEISQCFMLPYGTDKADFTALLNRLSEFSNTGLHIVLNDTCHLPENALNYVNNLISFLTSVNKLYPEITFETVS